MNTMIRRPGMGRLPLASRLLGCAVLAMFLAPVSGRGQEPASLADSIGLWKQAAMQRVVYGPQLMAAINLRLADAELRRGPRAADRSVARGAESVAVYRNAAPSIVYVTDGETGHGTGFFIRDGWILTNHHVVAGMKFDPATGVRAARIVTGHLDSDGAMTADSGFLDADVYRMDPVRDLALLRVRPGQQPERTIAALPLADEPPVPGALCVAIGHPSQGVLWTLREGEVAGRGSFPRDQIGEYFIRGADASLVAALDEIVDAMPTRKVLLSSCGLNPGDSGGPLLDAQGKLVAVSFAVPTIDASRGVDLGKFSYHVHLDEVKAFLADWPEQPEVVPPELLPPAQFQALIDLDSDGKLDAWVFGMDPEEPPSGFFLDLDGDTDPDFIQRCRKNGLEGASPLRDWDWEAAFTTVPSQTVSFDRDGDHEVDLVLVQQPESGGIRFDRESDGKWRVQPWDGDLKSGQWFESDADQKLFRKFLRKMQ